MLTALRNTIRTIRQNLRQGQLDKIRSNRYRARAFLQLEPLENRLVPVVATYTVNVTTDTNALNPNVGPQDAAGNISLRSAIQAANAVNARNINDVITIDFLLPLQSGTDDGGPSNPFGVPTIALTQNLELPLTSNISIVGGSGVDVQRSYGAGTAAYRIFNEAANKTCTMSNLYIENGSTAVPDSGGGILNAGTLGLTSVTLYNNRASNNGGAIENTGLLDLSDCTCTNNSAGGNGGAIANESSGQAWVGDSLITSNTLTSGGFGGGIYNGTSASLNLTGDWTVSANSASWGGGIFNNGQLLSTGGSGLLAGNSASRSGGGLYSDSAGTVTLTGVTIWDNRTGAAGVGGNGGGIYVNSGTVTCNSCTFRSNILRSGAGVGSGGSWNAQNGAVLSLNNCSNPTGDTFAPG
jgi:hypothetical protein